MILEWDDLARYRGLVTLVDGAFDPLHPGHLTYFQAARSFGPPLLVNICPDRCTQAKHPIFMSATDRAQILDNIACVKYVHVSERPTVEVLHQLQPKTYVKGSDWQDRLPEDHLYACAQYGTTIAYTKSTPHRSTPLVRSLQPDIEAFEALARRQCPAKTPWQPVTDYSLQERRRIEGRRPELIRDVLQPLSLLDYGAGYGYLVRFLRELGVDAWGYEPFVQPDQAIAGFIDAWLPLENPDVIVSREVLEHCTIQGIAQLVREMCDLRPRLIYGTTRFHPTPRHLLDFTTEFHIDPTHISCGTMDFLRMLFALQGYFWRADFVTAMEAVHETAVGRTFCFERAA